MIQTNLSLAKHNWRTDETDCSDQNGFMNQEQKQSVHARSIRFIRFSMK